MTEHATSIPLLERFPDLARAVPWTPLVSRPTPITELPRFAAAHSMGRIFAKREDLTHPECGGNKVRGLEFLLADAVAHGARTLVTAAAVGSNHILATAWHGRRLGLDTVALVLAQPPARYVQRNLRAGAALGVQYVPINAVTALPRFAAVWTRLKLGGRRPYLIPPGGTNAHATLGHVNAALELQRQIEQGLLPTPDVLFVGLGSLGTASGLAVGLRLAGLTTRLVGVVAFHRWYCTAGRWARLAQRTAAWMRRLDPTVPDLQIKASDLSVVPDALGRGYAHFTDEGVSLARELHTLEDFDVDGTYTAKLVDGALRFAHTALARDACMLIWHTRAALRTESLAASESTARLPSQLLHYLDTAQPLDWEI